MFNINSLKLRLLSIFLTATLIIGGSSLFLSETVRATASLQGGDFMQAFNNTTQEGSWRDPVSASPGDVIEFRVTIRNNGDTPARDVQVWGSINGQVPQDPAQQLVITGKINDPDASSSLTDAAIVNIIGNTPVGMRFYPGHTRINGVTDLYNCPNTCDVSDNLALGGFEIGDIAPGDFAELMFKASLSAIDSTPTPTPTVPVTPTPTPTVSLTPTPTPTVSVTPTPTPTAATTPIPTPTTSQQGSTNTNTNTQTQNQSQTNTQSQTATTGSSSSSSSSSSNVTVNNPNPQIVTVRESQVAGVTTTKELPKTGLPLLAWAAAAFLPAGYKLRGFNKISKGVESANFIWEEREFKKS